MTDEFFARLRPASWRGVPFHIKDSRLNFGQNHVVHEFVQRDAPWVESLGRKTRKFQITAFLFASAENGFNAWPGRDALVLAVEQGGIGDLIHPVYGILRGWMVAGTVSEATTQDAGRVSFDLEFVEDGGLEFSLAATVDRSGRVAAAHEAVIAALKDEFPAEFSVEDAQDFVVADAISMIRQFSHTIENVFDLDVIPTAEAQAAVAALALAQNLLHPKNIIAHMATALTAISERRLRDILRYNRTLPPPFSTTGRAQQAANRSAFIRAVRSTSVAEFLLRASQFASPRYNSTDTETEATPRLISQTEMQQSRHEAVEVATEEIYALSDAPIFPETQRALDRLKAEVVQKMTEDGEHLARTFRTTCCDGINWYVSMPTLVVAYRHYGRLVDASINARNEIPNPLFIPSNAGIDLLTELTGSAA